MTDVSDILTRQLLEAGVGDNLLMADRRPYCSWISSDWSPKKPSVTVSCLIQTEL